jgi:hypothetical protein
MIRRTLRSISFGLLILSIPAALASAQAVSTAQITGTVRDGSGGALPGVTVTATQTATGFKRETTTDGNGLYVLTNLPVGPYQLDATLQGFRSFRQTGLVLQVSTNPTVNVTLELGQVQETVSVQASASLVETRSPGIGQVITNQQVLELPLNGRQLTQLIFLAGLATGGSDVNAAQGASALNSVRNYPTVTITVAGGMSNGITYLLDGGTHNDPYNHLNLPLPFPDALQEFKVETSALPAQYGHHSAAAVNAVTKSGTNQVHGSGFEFFRDSALNATNPFAAVGPDGKRRDDGLRRHQFGGTLGGPVVRDKLFYFIAYQGTNVHVTPTSAFANVPTARMLAGDFSLIASPQCNNGRAITLPTPFVGNTISPAQFSRAALNITSRLPSGPDPCGRITFDRKNDSTEKIVVGRSDYQWTANHSVFGRVEMADFDSVSDFDGQNVLSASASPIQNTVWSTVVGDSLVLGSNTVNSIRATFNNTKIFKPGNETFDFNDVGIRSDGAASQIHPRRRRRRVQSRWHGARFNTVESIAVQRRPEHGARQPSVRDGHELHPRRVARCHLPAGRGQLPVHRAGDGAWPRGLSAGTHQRLHAGQHHESVHQQQLHRIVRAGRMARDPSDHGERRPAVGSVLPAVRRSADLRPLRQGEIRQRPAQHEVPQRSGRDDLPGRSGVPAGRLRRLPAVERLGAAPGGGHRSPG